jgi:membrane protease YdiL (CAAX protease family)
MKILSDIKRFPVLVYYVLVFLISWGSFLVIGGRGFFAGTNWQIDPMFLTAVTGLLLGPPVASILLTIVFYKRAGLRDLLSRLLLWRVGLRWYMAALFIAPLVEAGVLLILSLISPVFLPKIFLTVDKIPLLISGLTIGLVGGLVEELGWTGFATPRLRMRFGILTTGCMMGVMWGVWHMPQMWWVGRTSNDTIAPALFLTLYFLLAIVQLTAFRILMVWVYSRTKSLLVAVLMHASYIFSTLFVFAPPTTGVPFLTYSGTFTIILWLIVAMVSLSSRKRHT